MDTTAATSNLTDTISVFSNLTVISSHLYNLPVTTDTIAPTTMLVTAICNVRQPNGYFTKIYSLSATTSIKYNYCYCKYFQIVLIVPLLISQLLLPQ